MEKNFTQQDIDKFLSDFKKLSNPYKIEKVHQLLNNPYAKARHSAKLNYKPFNFIIMTSALIIGLSALLIWSNQKKIDTNEISTFQKSEIEREVVVDSTFSPGKISELNQQQPENPAFKTADEPKNNNPVQSVLVNESQFDTERLAFNPEPCSWPADTIIDKKLLLLELSDKELRAIGIARIGQSTFYHNIIEGQYDMSLTSQPESIPDEQKNTTFNKFYVAYTTNSQFEPGGSANFYSSMDTLIPVITNNQAGRIYWFTPHESFFNLLPGRYSYLRNTYKNLICLKNKYPKRTFTNYLETGNEHIIDQIKVLNLNKEELEKIGILINDECVIFQTKNKKYTLKICKTGTYSSGNDEDQFVFPPNPYPVLMTDTLGRRLYVVNSITNKDSLSKIMNFLVPVRVNLSEIISKNQEEIICWYYPTQEFLNSLPKKIGPEIKSELNNITNGSKGSSISCNYFEVCKSSLKLDNFKLYPNPASSSVTIEFENSEEIIGSISIVNMAGLKLREILPNTTFLSGHNSYQMNLSGINSGIYLIYVKTNKGFKTQRLIVSQ